MMGQPKWADELFNESRMWHTQAEHGLATLAGALIGGLLFGVAGWLLPLWTFTGSFAIGALAGVWPVTAFYHVREFGLPVMPPGLPPDLIAVLEGAHRFYKAVRKVRGPYYQRDLDVHLWDSKSDAFFPYAVATTVTVLVVAPHLWPFTITMWGLVCLNALVLRPHPELWVDGLK